MRVGSVPSCVTTRSETENKKEKRKMGKYIVKRLINSRFVVRGKCLSDPCARGIYLFIYLRREKCMPFAPVVHNLNDQMLLDR